MGDSEREMQQGIRMQLLCVFLGALILFFCIVAMFAVWAWNSGQTLDALNLTADRFREKQADKFAGDLAVLLRPLWTIARRFAFDMQSAVEFEGSTVFPLSVHTYNNTDQLVALMRYLYAKTTRTTHMHSVQEDGVPLVYNQFIGTVTVLAFDNNYMPTHDLAKCAKAVFGTNILNQNGGYMCDIQSMDVNGTLSRRLQLWDPVNLTLGQELMSIPVLTCAQAMAPLWFGKSYAGEVFANYTWFGPFNPNVGWGNHEEGNVPIYDSHGNHVGRIGTALSLGKSVGPLLERVIQDGGDLTKGGAAAVYESSTDTVIGLSEKTASSGQEQAKNLVAIVKDSQTLKAINEIKHRFNNNCPSTRERINLDEQLVDVSPFSTEPYGMPPLPNRWCLLMTVPRENVYRPIDTAADSAIAMLITALVGVVLAFLLLGRSVYNARRAQIKMNAERNASYMRRIQKADDEMQTLGVPMAVMHWSNFNAMEVLQCFEDQRNAGKLVFLDSVGHVRQFQKQGNLIVLISHQWVGYSMPDTLDCIQLRAMQRMIKQLADESNEDLWVWLDYTSVAQRHAGMQALAINSLPAYVSMVDRFLICAPDARHRDDATRMCNVESYSRRGWCRTEMLAKACSSGLQHMYLCGGDGTELQPLAREDFQRLSLNVFQGDFTVRTDMEKLVEPALGLYALILKSSDTREHIAQIKEHIEEDKANFFPKEYAPNLDMQNEKRTLFGPLVEMMEDHVRDGSGAFSSTRSIAREDKLRGEDVRPSTQVPSALSISVHNSIPPVSSPPIGGVTSNEEFV